MFMIQLLGEQTQVWPEGGGKLRQCHARYNLAFGSHPIANLQECWYGWGMPSECWRL